ncbi:MAG: glycoside hydrolase family 99-like domain-containing protein [Sulfuricurvum sp.]|nr:glycoside hydrolase family 99-like domain-containing protein [Sulfuricurvum sp.]
MSKYNIELDLETKNSLALILNRVKRGSKILEFGPSHGRLTKFLKEKMGCRVYCVELDENAAAEASQYAEEMLVGDIESFYWEKHFGEHLFDHIIFADVLEHLYRPKNVLLTAKKYLKENGSILISIPNVAHASILIDLLHNNFTYRSVGLLDDTHIRFFTKTTLNALVQESGLFIKYETSVNKHPETTEFHNSYNELPSEVASFLKHQPFSEAYQFILELVADKPEQVISDINTAEDIELFYQEEPFVDFTEHESFSSKIKTIAFYLPQFHPFEENDKWWGKGFTEWTNVTKATPNFFGHYQPHLPIHNGFYDLRLPEVMIEQARLAKNYGIHGFNFYYYWFDGKVLMHKPFEILLNNKNIDINFCITWANENWTRIWDASENDILIAQKHSDEDSIKFIHSLFPYFNDKRYITIDNKPLLVIYRCDIIPNIVDTVKLWRREVEKAGYDGIYLVCAQTYGVTNPEDYGFDAAMEFPPHNALNLEFTTRKKMINTQFKGNIYDYSKIVNDQCTKKTPDYKCFQAVTLSWDNTARKQNDSNIFTNFTLHKYKQWLSHIAHNTYNSNLPDNEKLIFVNAWNEWAEGTHLEPDRKFGYGYLESTYNVLKNYDLDNLSSLNSGPLSKQQNTAIILHVHEGDDFDCIKQLLDKYEGIDYDLYATIVTFSENLVQQLRQHYPNIRITLVERAGEDALSFLQIYRQIQPLGYQHIWKLHSKRKAYLRLSPDQDYQYNLLLVHFDYDDKKIAELSNYLDVKFCDPDSLLALNEEDEEIPSKDTADNIDNLIHQLDAKDDIEIPKSNTLALSNKLSLMFKKIDQIKEDYQHIVIYGYGYLGKIVLQSLEEKVVAVIDKNMNKNAATFPVIHPSEIQAYDYDCIIVTVIGREKEVIKTLLSHNVAKEKIILL